MLPLRHLRARKEVVHLLDRRVVVRVLGIEVAGRSRQNRKVKAEVTITVAHYLPLQQKIGQRPLHHKTQQLFQL